MMFDYLDDLSLTYWKV